MSGSRYLIVLPTRNGGDYLKQCVASILAQSHGEFRLLVLDNASTDDTASWLADLRDDRIEVHTSAAALAIEDNWARIAQSAAREEFMTIIGHDDLLDSGYLAGMSDLIARHPQAGLYQAHFRLIDARGRTIRACLPMPEYESAQEFLAMRLRLLRDSFGTGYMFRVADYVRVGGIPRYRNLIFADDALWLNLMAGSYKATCPRPLFAYRAHRFSAAAASAWRPTFQALHSYLQFLGVFAEVHAPLRQVLRQGLADYVLYWARWARFGSAPDADSTAILAAIHAMPALDMLLGAARLQRLAQRLPVALNGRMARPRWLAWRLTKYARIRAAARFKSSQLCARTPGDSRPQPP